MRYLEHTTRLEAVNTILGTIGNSPVSSIEGTGIEDVEIAASLIDEVTRRVSLTSYNWNTDENYALSPNASGYIEKPAGALSVDPQSPQDNFVVRRNPATNILSLWNKDDQTWVFGDPVDVKITWGFPFEDLPEEARNFIVLSAGRMFQKRVVGAQVLDRYTAEDEARAWALLTRAELRSRDFNLFRQNRGMAYVNNRQY